MLQPQASVSVRKESTALLFVTDTFWGLRENDTAKERKKIDPTKSRQNTLKFGDDKI